MWCFALINNRLGELYFERDKNGKALMNAHCYVSADEFKTKHEQIYIKRDTAKFKFSYRNGWYRDKIKNIRYKGVPFS